MSDNAVDIRLVPRGRGSCGPRHGLDLTDHGDRGITLHVCACFQFTFPGHPEVTEAIETGQPPKPRGEA